MNKYFIKILFLASLLGFFANYGLIAKSFSIEKFMSIASSCNSDTTSKIIADHTIMIDTLYTAEVSKHKIKITNTGHDDLHLLVSGNFIKNNAYQNYALDFDGMRDIINCGDLGFGDDVKGITVEIYYKPRSIVEESGCWEFVCADSAFMFSLGIYTTLYSAKTRGDYHYYMANPAHEWVHVTMIYDGQTQRFYLFGYQAELASIDYIRPTVPIGRKLDLYKKPFCIGSKDNYRQLAFGQIDEVRIWDTIRTIAEIRHNMNRKLTGKEKHLVAYWDFDEGKGDTLFDQSKNRYHGVLIGDITWVRSTAPVVPFTWLEVNPDSEVIYPDSSADLEIILNAANLDGGDYNTQLNISSENQNYMLLNIPVHLHVINAPDIAISEDTLRFPDMFAGESYNEHLTITNNGYKNLEVKNIKASKLYHDIDTTEFELGQTENQDITITYRPGLFSKKYHKLIFQTNDPKNHTMEVIISRGQIMIAKDKLIRWITIFSLFILLIFLVMVYYRYRLKIQHNRNLEHKVQEAIEKQNQQEQIIVHQSGLTSLGEMAAGIAHEINVPLQNILIANESIEIEKSKSESDSKVVKQMVVEIYTDSDRINKLVEHVSIFSTAQKTDLAESFSINETILSALSMTRIKMANLGINLDVNLEETIPKVTGNSFKFEQVIVNMLNNARDAVQIKESKRIVIPYSKTIQLLTYFKNGSVVTEISDNGIGIAEENQGKIFNPFFTTKELGKGTGLGLSISYGLLQEMNGTIDVKSKINQGTTFKIYMPV